MRAEPHLPVAVPLFGQRGVVGGDDGVMPGLDRRIRIGCRPVEFGVALAQQREGVLVRSEPDVQPVLFDPAIRTAARRALAAQPPAALIDRDRFEPVPPAGFAEPPGRTQPRHAAAEDGDLASWPSHPSSVRAARHVRPGAVAGEAGERFGDQLPAGIGVESEIIHAQHAIRISAHPGCARSRWPTAGRRGAPRRHRWSAHPAWSTRHRRNACPV